MASMYEKQGMSLPRLQHASLAVPAGTQEQVRAFYGEALGLREKQVPHTLSHLGLVWFEVGDGAMELHFTPDDAHLPNPDEARHICLEVADLDAYRARIEKAGHHTFEADPIPYRPRFFCHDPFGNRLEFTTILDDYRQAQ